MIRVPVEASVHYDVLIGSGLLEEAGKLTLGVTAPCKLLIITDEIVDALYGDAAVSAFRDAGFQVTRYVFTHGEPSKNMHTLAAILEFAAENRMTRTDLFAGLGGGIAGDVAGMAAAVYQRGVRYVQIPTTFLAAIDSSVGGKTAVNLVAGKNLAGAFWQPSLVICDFGTFGTLPPEVFADGAAEAIKYGMISDPELLEMLEAGPSGGELEKIIVRCVNIKRKLVSQDEFDRGNRQLLNFGHTLGHAIEKCSDYAVSHGHAVAIGMVMMARAAEKLGLVRESSLSLLIDLLNKYRLPVRFDTEAGKLADAVLGDKKRNGDMLTIVIPLRPGRCVLHPIPVSELPRLIRLGQEEA